MALIRHRALPYVLPFALFIAVLAVRGSVPVSEIALSGAWILIVGLALLLVSRPIIDLRLSQPVATIVLGVAVFVIWIAPDAIFPGYRSHWLFQNRFTGAVATTITATGRTDGLMLTLRIIRAVAIVPIAEELFWRGFMMRWIIRPDFEKVPLGTYETRAFWITAILFASEHGPYWDVGLITGVILNWWLIRTRRLGDVIWAHAITNGCLCGYVLLTHKWEYWM